MDGALRRTYAERTCQEETKNSTSFELTIATIIVLVRKKRRIVVAVGFIAIRITSVVGRRITTIGVTI